MSKKFGRPPKISGDPQKFPATPKNFRRPPKISGDVQNDQNVAGGENVTFCQLSLSKCTPSNVLVGVQEKSEFGLYWGGTGFPTKSDNFREFFVHFCQISKFPENPGCTTPGKPARPRKASPATPRADCPKKSSALARVINVTRDPPKSPKRSKSPGRPRNFPAAVAPDFPRRPPATPGDPRKKHEKRPLFKCLQV